MSAILKQKLIDIANGFTKYGLWKGGGSSALSDMTDVSFTNLQTNDVLTYNGSVWVNDDNLHEYSTEEKVVGKWIDGKTIYEKVIIIDNPTSGVDVLYSHSISNFNHVININVVYITNGGIEYSEPIYLNSNYARSCAIDSTKLYITTKGGNYTQLYVTIQYTKTTD